MQTDAAGTDFIRNWESPDGPLLTIKPDDGGKLQIGWGHDLRPGEEVEFADGITYDEAVLLNQGDIAESDAAVNSLGWDLNQNQHNALSDFTFECGSGALNQLAAHGQDQVPAQLPRWIYAHVNGVVTKLDGMVKRRAAEVALYQS